MTIETVCPKTKEPTESEFIRSSVMTREVWEPIQLDDGLCGAVTKKWKSIVVKCGLCGEEHEYALTMNPS